ncbi:outer membrane protein assembly factor BamA [Kangiella sp. TOML190]|uniref:outer membrane protein assembly factor BamA n=1 Tax=Kangiella sp. TOML190 TaxID=2931351 RepID=UPI00203F8F3D|nr:outer membrane protein assembly factor BamA [Kangiella sp. TOML190]
MRFITKTLTALTLSLAFAKSYAIEPFVIEDIQVEGLQRVELGTFFTALPIRVGETIDDARVPNIIRSLYKTGNFDFVKLEKVGNTLKVSVAERPTIANIILRGNKILKTDQLLDGLKNSGIAKGEVLNSFVLDKMEQAITGQYFSNGHYHLNIEKKTRELSRNRVQLIIEIKEGNTALVKSISIVGNKIFSDQELLEQMESTTGGAFSFITSDNKYSSEVLDKDIETIESYYRDRGYVKFKVDKTLVSLSDNKEEVYITLNVSEGEVFRVNKVNFIGELIYDLELYERIFPLKKDDIFSQALVTFNEEQIKNLLGLEGFTFAEVNTAPEILEDTNEVNINVLVRPGERYYAKSITFDGNVSTDDAVFRREARMQEGTPLSSSLVERSKQRIQRLPFVEEVNVDVKKSENPGEADVAFSIEERNSSEATFSLGYNDFYGLQLQAGVTNRNFLGSGKTLGVNLNTNKAIDSVNVNYSDPYFFNDTIGFNSSLSYRQTDFSKFNTIGKSLDTLSLGFGVYYPISEISTVNFGVSLQDSTLKAPVINGEQDQRIIDFYDELGADARLDDSVDFDVISFSLGWQANTLNRFIFPTNGFSHNVGLEYASSLGDVEYYKLQYDFKHYFPISDSDWIVLLRANLGYGQGLGDTDRLPYFVNFYSGGETTIRGFETNTIGPKSILRRIGAIPVTPPIPGLPPGGVILPEDQDFIFIEDRFSVGGNAKAFTSLELIFPTPFLADNKNVRTSAFIDVGNVWDTEFDPNRFNGLTLLNDDITQVPDYSKASRYRGSYGISLQWWSPFAPLAFSVSRTFKTQEFDDSKTFTFTIGQTF